MLLFSFQNCSIYREKSGKFRSEYTLFRFCFGVKIFRWSGVAGFCLFYAV